MVKGSKASPEIKEKLRLSHLGKHQTEETKKKISENSWFRGHSERNPFYGKHLSEEHKRHISEGSKNSPNSGRFKKGQLAWNKDLKGRHFSPNSEFKVGHWKGRVLTREEISKKLARRPMSSLELKVQRVIKKNSLPYIFVGNGKFFIERKNPDFININGKKIAIEVYYKRHKELFRGNVEGWKEERSNIFAKYGWTLLFFDETQLEESYLLKVLKTDVY